MMKSGNAQEIEPDATINRIQLEKKNIEIPIMTSSVDL